MTAAARSQVLKAGNIKWLVMLAMLDAGVIFLFVAPGLVQADTFTALRASLAPVLPVAVLILNGLISHETKARLVYWKLTNPLPGSEAFTRHAPADARIDMAALKRNVGVLPTDPADQNAKWYKLYRRVSGDPAVVEAHRLYLLYRDMAAISIMLVPLVPAALFHAGSSGMACAAASALFAVQYLLCAISARHSGIRLVTNVLAIHATRKVAAAP
ncbi:hypothetical protein CI1B_31980 [Bradyrhizobium ivorense]|uniref:Uncharacterized protein n=1 Tax=Bradyrhizobium ivorense TaxID=2511166 RepID=A0A508T9J7_9BRAD|nr:hypothetical protein [Bradyrhizobium ivorense]VIO70544.1 hypothetical protein CI1B_31980 [Bradyrhizobium ivorense]VIO79222.1 hypothetical protein CI41S_67900 [Bradyrhizobium ivorense]